MVKKEMYDQVFISTFEIGEDKLNDILEEEKLKNKISIYKIYDLFKKLYLNLHFRFENNFVDYTDYINILERKRKAVFLLFQNNESIIQNYIILEVKFERSCYSKIESLLHNIPIRASRNSKYINSIRTVIGI